MIFKEVLEKIRDRNNFLNIKDYPDAMTEMGKFTYLRTYSRYIPELKRREVWRETIERAVAWSISLDDNIKDDELFELFDAVYNLKVQLAGRTLWVGGTEVANQFPLANFNCSFTLIEKIEDFCDLFYLSMLGSGVGFSVEDEYITKLPHFKHIKAVHVIYSEKLKKDRLEHSNLRIVENRAIIDIGDSKEGWCKALRYFMELNSNPMYSTLTEVLINYDSVRPKGEPLKKFGGFASGHEYLQRMFEKISKIIEIRCKDSYSKLKAIDVLDICNIIGENVVSGGVRRTAQMCLSSAEQNEIENAKADLYKQVDGVWVENEDIIHRRLSNNTIKYYEKPSMGQISNHVDKIRFSGEPGFLNMVEAKRRFEGIKGGNPCLEILLRNKGNCNLVAVDMAICCSERDAEEMFSLATRHCLRITTLDLELPSWNETLHEDRLLGVSITGLMDYKNRKGASNEFIGEWLAHYRKVATKSADDYADELGISHSKNVTTIKPAGTQSLLGGKSAGVHNQWGKYYIRRIRISSFDPLFKAMQEMGYNLIQDTGAKDGETYVVEFPCKSDADRDINDISAIEQMDMYKLTMDNYTDQNTSCTINVGDNEWDDVKAWLYLNWDSVVGLSFIPKSNSYYPLLPYETISEGKYLEMLEKQPKFIPSIVNKHDNSEEFEVTSDCATGG